MAGDRTTRLLALVALSLATLALVLSFLAWRRGEARDAEVQRLRDALDRAQPLRPGAGHGPPLGLDPGDPD
jgi:hypothetical protein